MNQADLAVEIVGLRQQLGIYHRSVPRPKLRTGDRIFWVWLRSFWSGWRTALVIVSPDTMVGSYHLGFRLFGR